MNPVFHGIPRVPRLWSGPIARADGIHRFPAKMALGLGDVFVSKVLPSVAEEADLSGERFHDPMCGSGTSMLVARRSGLVVSGSDILPTSTVIASAKLNRLGPAELQQLLDFLEADHLSRESKPLWSWPTARIWFTPRGLRALQDIRSDIGGHRGKRHFPHLLTALSWTCWDASSADPQVIVPTHSARSPANRSTAPDRVQEWFRARLGRIVMAQTALKELGFDSAKVDVWEADVRTARAWPNDARFVLTSPPYGIGIDYVRASSIQSHVLFPDVDPAIIRNAVLGRPRWGDVSEDVLPAGFSTDRWWRVMQSGQPTRAIAFLVFLEEFRSVLCEARKRVPSDGVIGMIMGNPQTCGRWTIPLVEITAEMALTAGFKEAYPRITSSIRRRLQSASRRSASSPIRTETMLTLVPN